MRSPGRRVGLALRLAAALSLALAMLAPAGVLAADPTFAKGTSTQTFGENITVEQRVTLPSGVLRVEAYVRSPGGSSTFLAEIPNPGAGAHTLTYSDATPSRSLMPNTLLELGFRITLADGSTPMPSAPSSSNRRPAAPAPPSPASPASSSTPSARPS